MKRRSLLTSLCLGVLSLAPPVASADNFVQIEGKNKAGQLIVIDRDWDFDNQRRVYYISVWEPKRIGKPDHSYEDEPCTMVPNANVRARLKACADAGQPECSVPPGTDWRDVELSCAASGKSPLAGTRYKIIHVDDEEHCLGARYECVAGCDPKRAPLVMLQRIDECGGEM
jgi:rubredoxin